MNITEVQDNNFFFNDLDLEKDQEKQPPISTSKTLCLSIFEKLDLARQKNISPNTLYVPHQYVVPLSYGQSSQKEMVSKMINEAFRRLLENRLDPIPEMLESAQPHPLQQLSSMTPVKGLMRKSPTSSNLMQAAMESSNVK